MTVANVRHAINDRVEPQPGVTVQAAH